MAAIIRVLNAAAEYQARFPKPLLRLVADRGDTIQAVVDALLPFGFRLTNTDVLSQGGIAEQKVGFRLPERNLGFQFGAEGCFFAKDGASWATAEEDLAVLKAAENAVLTSNDVALIAVRTVTIAMHLQLLDTPREEILARFAPTPFYQQSLTPPPGRAGYTPIGHAVLVKWKGGAVLVDESVVIANAIFVRLTSEIQGGTMRDLFEKLYRDEEYLFNILGVEEQVAPDK